MEPIHRLILAIELLHLLTISVVISLVVVFLIIVGRKMLFFDYLQARVKNRVLFELLSCDFCIGFWLSVIFTILAFIFIVPFTWLVVIVPMMSAAINNTLSR